MKLNLLFLTIFLGFGPHLFTRASQLDSLETVLNTTKDIEIKIETTIQIGQHYNQLAMDTSAVFFNQALEMATRIGNRELMSNSGMSLASYYGYLAQNTDTAYAIARKSRDLILYMGDTSELYIKYCGKTELYGGLFEIDQGSYSAAQKHLLDAVGHFEKIDAYRSALGAYNQLIYLYSAQEKI